MKFQSLPALAEILPYYGTLDRVFLLVKTLCYESNKIWEDTKTALQHNIRRKKMIWDLTENDQYKVLIENPTIFDLFRFQYFQNENEENYLDWSNFIDKLLCPEMSNICFACNLSPSRDTEVTISTLSQYKRQTDLSYLQHYNWLVNKMKMLKIDISTVFSFVFAEELPLIYESTYIFSVIFVWDKKASCTDLIKLWSNFWTLSKCKVTWIQIVWQGMEAKGIESLLNSINHNHIEIVIKNVDFTKFLDCISQIDLPANQRIKIKWRPKNDKLLYLLSGASEISLNEVWFLQEGDLFKNLKIFKNVKFFNQSVSKIFPEKLKINISANLQCEYDILQLNCDEISHGSIQSIKIKDNNLIIKQNRIKRLRSDMDTPIINSSKKISISFEKISSKYSKCWINKCTISFPELNESEFNDIIKEMYSSSHITYLTLNNIPPSLVILFLEKCKPIYACSKRLVLNLSKNNILVQYIQLKEIKKELEKSNKKMNISSSKKQIIIF